ncbi:MAG: outer membrane lipid asymmetry maintenance protein MlaD [Candidatus Binatia bacterium]
MNANGTRDFVTGLFVLAGLVSLAWLSFTVGGLRYTGDGGLPVYALFDQVAGLKPKSPVEIAGVRVGQVSGIGLDETFRARVDLDLDSTLELPIDSSAAIVTAGILGDRYIQLTPGAEEEMMKPGEQIAYTESALVLERLIGKFLVNVGDKSKEGESGDAPEEKTP